MKKLNLLAILGMTALLAVSCCNQDKTCTAKQDCAADCEKTYTVYNPDETINLKNMPLFFESDKAEVTQVNPTTTRKMTYLNDLMMCIVEIEGPMAEPDPFHSHDAEQICYIAEGDCIVIIGEERRQLKAGDIFAVPGGVPHTVQALGPKLKLIDAFNPIREDFIK